MLFLWLATRQQALCRKHPRWPAMVLQTRTEDRPSRKLLSVLEDPATEEVTMKKGCEQCGSQTWAWCSLPQLVEPPGVCASALTVAKSPTSWVASKERQLLQPRLRFASFRPNAECNRLNQLIVELNETAAADGSQPEVSEG